MLAMRPSFSRLFIASVNSLLPMPFERLSRAKTVGAKLADVVALTGRCRVRARGDPAGTG